VKLVPEQAFEYGFGGSEPGKEQFPHRLYIEFKYTSYLIANNTP